MKIFEIVEPKKIPPIPLPTPIEKTSSLISNLQSEVKDINEKIFYINDAYKNLTSDDSEGSWDAEMTKFIADIDAQKRQLADKRDQLEEELFALEEKNFQDIVDYYSNLVETECSEFLQISKFTRGELLYRGVGGSTTAKQSLFPSAFPGVPNSNRSPTDSSTLMQFTVDSVLKKSGFEALRSNSIFTTSNYDMAREYGKVYVVFPKDGFDFTWSSRYRDFYEDFILGLFGEPLQFLDKVDGLDLPTTRVKVMSLKKELMLLMQQLAEVVKNEPSEELTRYYTNLEFYLKQFLPDLEKQEEDRLSLFTNRMETLLTDVSFFVRNVNVTSFIDKIRSLLWNLTQVTEKDIKDVIEKLTPIQAREIASAHGFTNSNINWALDSKHELLIKGAYYAFEFKSPHTNALCKELIGKDLSKVKDQ
jgi:hypothetical protein